jgi:hypothetical protein
MKMAFVLSALIIDRSKEIVFLSSRAYLLYKGAKAENATSTNSMILTF